MDRSEHGDWRAAGASRGRGGEQNVKVAARVLTASFCQLIPSRDSMHTIARSDLWALKDSAYVWPSLDSLEASHLHGLAKAIANNIMQNFFTANVPGLANAKARRVMEVVIFEHYLSVFFVFTKY